MKVRIKNFNGELPGYLTEGKEYKVQGRRSNMNNVLIYCDRNLRTFITIDSCHHLKGGSWEVVE